MLVKAFYKKLKCVYQMRQDRNFYKTACALFDDLPKSGVSWMSHTDYIDRPPGRFTSATQPFILRIDGDMWRCCPYLE